MPGAFRNSSDELLVKPPHDHELRLYGHRGSSSRLPENTLPAFAAALEDGANALELDIHRTADGHFVVAHDPDGHRTAGIAGHIRELSLREVLSWNVAVGAKGSNLDPHSVPTLDEVLQAFPGVPMSVDLKPDDPGAVPPLLDLLANHRAEDRVTLASFNGQLVYAIRRLGYRGRTAIYELLILSEPVKDALIQRRTSYEIRRISIESTGLVSLLEDGILKAIAGQTSFEEIIRTLPRLAPPRPLSELKRLQGVKS